VHHFFPYAGGGVGFVSYHEKSDFSDGDINESFTSYHILGGVDVPVSQWIGVGGEVLYRWVPDALGDGGIAGEFDESDLGGLALKVRVTFGR
jgi:opacity protein-like surface antigen